MSRKTANDFHSKLRLIVSESHSFKMRLVCLTRKRRLLPILLTYSEGANLMCIICWWLNYKKYCGSFFKREMCGTSYSWLKESAVCRVLAKLRPWWGKVYADVASAAERNNYYQSWNSRSAVSIEIPFIIIYICILIFTFGDDNNDARNHAIATKISRWKQNVL